MSYLEDILKKLGWDNGFQMPVASAENHALEEELAQLTLHKNKAKHAMDTVLGRLANLKDHFKYVTQENEQTQKLITAHKQQYDSDGNQYYSLKGETNKLTQDITEVNKRMQYLEERRGIQINDLEKAAIKVDKLKQETGWDIEALKAWEEALKKRDDDNELIKKFSKEDERKFNDLEARRQLLQGEHYNKSMTVSKMVCDLHSCEMIIERTGKAIKQQINERENLIKQWKDAVKMLQQRDGDIETGQERIIEAHKVLERQQDRLGEEKAMLNNELKNNHETEMDIEKMNNLNSRMRREWGELQQSVLLIINDYHTVKRRVAASANILEQARMKSRKLDQMVSQKEKQCIKDQEDIHTLEIKISQMKGNTASSGERINRVQKMIDMEEKHCTILMADTEKINSNLYRTDQILKEQQTIGKNLEVQINNSYWICNKLSKHIEDEKKALEKLKEVVYDMQFRIDEFEQRLCKLEGSNKQDNHSDEKEENIKELEKTLYDHTEVQHTLQTQVDRLQDEMRKLSNFIEADKEQLQILKNKVENHLLIYDIGRKQIAAAKKSSQEKQVEENIMRLRINHIVEDMEKEKLKIFDLQKLRLTLDQVMKERNLEIDTKKSIVLAKKRSLEEDKGRLKGDITLRKVKLDQLQKKYHIELMSLGKDEDGQPLSVTFYKIKFAQEKFMLQQQGDDLDQKIKVAEKEIIALENTLKMVNLTNMAFKNNLSQIKQDDVEVVEMKALDKSHKEWTVKTREARQQLTEHQDIVTELTQTFQETRATRAEKKKIVVELEEENVLVENQVKDKEEKLKRTEKQVRKALKALSSRDITIYDLDLEIRHLKEANNSVMKKLYHMTNEYPDAAPNINKYSADYDINLASQSTLSSNTYSTVSSNVSADSSSRSLVMPMAPVMVTKVDITFTE